MTTLKPSFPENVWLGLVKNAISERLENNEIIVSKYCALILNNTEGWLRFKHNDEFPDEALEGLYLFYEKPLKLYGFNDSISNPLQQWHLLVEYVLTYLSPDVNSYCILWCRISESSKHKEWNLVLYVVELLFALPVSNAKIKRLFSLMNKIKTDSRNC